MNENKDNKYVHYILKILSRVSKVEKLVTTIITAKIINCLLEFIKTSKLSIVHEYVSKIMINLIKKKHIIKAASLIINKKINLKGIITHKYKLFDYKKAFLMAKNQKGLKIIINP